MQRSECVLDVLSASVPASDEAVPSPCSTIVSDQHLPGRWYQDVVPVERAERIHRELVGLWLLPRLTLRLNKLTGPAG